MGESDSLGRGLKEGLKYSIMSGFPRSLSR